MGNLGNRAARPQSWRVRERCRSFSDPPSVLAGQAGRQGKDASRSHGNPPPSSESDSAFPVSRANRSRLGAGGRRRLPVVTLRRVARSPRPSLTSHRPRGPEGLRSTPPYALTCGEPSSLGLLHPDRRYRPPGPSRGGSRRATTALLRAIQYCVPNGTSLSVFKKKASIRR
jgi:hypothetical protein